MLDLNKDYVDNDVKVRDHCHFTGKYKGSVRNCNINLNVNHKIPIEFHNLNNYDSHLIMQELSQINLKILNLKCYTKWIREIYELYYQ